VAIPPYLSGGPNLMPPAGETLPGPFRALRMLHGACCLSLYYSARLPDDGGRWSLSSRIPPFFDAHRLTLPALTSGFACLAGWLARGHTLAAM
jgi:hypothetical protein